MSKKLSDEQALDWIACELRKSDFREKLEFIWCCEGEFNVSKDAFSDPIYSGPCLKSAVAAAKELQTQRAARNLAEQISKHGLEGAFSKLDAMDAKECE